jgi:hypothetical protein
MLAITPVACSAATESGTSGAGCGAVVRLDRHISPVLASGTVEQVCDVAELAAGSALGADFAVSGSGPRPPCLFYGLLLVNIFARRTLKRWSALNIIVLIVMGSCSRRAFSGNAPLLGTLLAVAEMVVGHRVLGRAAARFAEASALLEGSPTEFGSGSNQPQRCKRQGVSALDLEEAARRSKLPSITQASSVVFELSSSVNVIA